MAAIHYDIWMYGSNGCHNDLLYHLANMYAMQSHDISNALPLTSSWYTEATQLDPKAETCANTKFYIPFLDSPEGST
jgi:hypothetical protein